MTTLSPQDLEFVNQLNAKIEEHIAEETFGVSELADAMNMSRSNLLRKVKKATNLSVSQLISQVRLQHGMELLRTTSLNVSEVSHRVGFNSTSYFIKCFREYYGYPPGEANKHVAEPTVPIAAPPEKSTRAYWIIAAGVIMIALGWFVYTQWSSKDRPVREKSIVVLPFKNDSADSTNVYIINGLMEATLNNLQKIKDLRVLSRTSAEKYRNSEKTIPEMAKELNVAYFIEGSGQKMGDRIVLTIQLIDGVTDRHLWSRQYRREASDIFALQQEISKDISAEIQAVITPEERTRIEKVLTQNPEAYDVFLKGVDLVTKFQGGDQALKQSLVYFDDAIQKDNSFAAAYACAAMACYYLDMFKSDKEYLDELTNYADNAMLHDPTLGESLTAKAMYYLERKEYGRALPYLEKGLEYNPNSSQIIGLLADFYSNHLPNTGKYLEYALKGAQLDAGSGDSISVSNFYLRLGNALIQTGFIDESLKYIDKSLVYNKNNPYSRYVRAFVVYAKNKNLKETKNLLLTEFNKDTMRLDILQDIGKVCYYLKEYDSSYLYYKRFNNLRDIMKLDIYQHENMMIGLAYEKAGETKKAKEFMASYRKYLDTDQTAYKDLGLCAYYDYIGDTSQAIMHLKRFALQDNIQYWIILFMRQQPMPGKISELPECVKIMDNIEAKFWATHEKLKLELEEKGLMR